MLPLHFQLMGRQKEANKKQRIFHLLLLQPRKMILLMNPLLFPLMIPNPINQASTYFPQVRKQKEKCLCCFTLTLHFQLECNNFVAKICFQSIHNSPKKPISCKKKNDTFYFYTLHTLQSARVNQRYQYMEHILSLLNRFSRLLFLPFSIFFYLPSSLFCIWPI